MPYESCDKSGKQQLSIGVRFLDQGKMMVHEKFLGFVELSSMDTKSIASPIDNFVENAGLDPGMCVGQGYMGVSSRGRKG